MKNGSIRRTTALKNAQSAPSGDVGVTNAADPPEDALSAAPLPLSRTWNEIVNERERVEAWSPGGAVGDGETAIAVVGDGGAGTAGVVVTDAAGVSVAFAVAVGVGVGVPVPASSISVT